MWFAAPFSTTTMKISSLILPMAFFTHSASAALAYFSCNGGTPESACAIAAFEVSDCIEYYGTLLGCDENRKNCKYCAVRNTGDSCFQSAVGSLTRFCSNMRGEILQSSEENNNLPVCV